MQYDLVTESSHNPALARLQLQAMTALCERRIDQLIAAERSHFSVWSRASADAKLAFEIRHGCWEVVYMHDPPNLLEQIAVFGYAQQREVYIGAPQVIANAITVELPRPQQPGSH